MIPRWLKARWAACWRSGLVGAILAAIVAGIFAIAEPVKSWVGALSYDLPFGFSGRLRTTEAVIVSMDEPSYHALDQNVLGTWDRGLHARLLDRLTSLGARLVVFDILFDKPSTNPVVDREFAAALDRANGRVLLAASLERNLEGPDAASTNSLGTVINVPILPHLPVTSSVPWGVTQFEVDRDMRVRRHSTNDTYPILAWKAAELLGRVPPDPRHPRWINFYGPPDSLPRQHYHEVLWATNLAPSCIDGKVAFVGRYGVITPLGPSREDLHPTPFTRLTGHPFSGVELQATAFLNLYRGDWIEELPRAWESLAFVLSGLGFGFGLVLLRPWVAAPAALLGAGMVFLAALALFFQRVWFPWMIIVAGQIPCALLWSVVAHTQWLSRENADLERKLATSLLAAGSARARPDSADSNSGRVPVVPDHTLIRRVAQGSYGEVWLARDLVGNYRAVKAIYRDRFPRIEPFEREFRGIQKYSPISRTHPGWLDILHVGRNEADGCFFYIMEAGDDEATGQRIDPDRYVPRSLAGDLARRGKVPLDECVQLGLALSDAMAHLHRHGLIHRDIKPSNVIFVQGAPKFADIGLVTDVNEPGRNASLLGTEGYIAPEGPGSPLADLFSLGKLLYEISTGHDRRVFPEMPTSLIEGGSDPRMERLYQILLKACEIEPRYRYQTADELHADLLQLQRANSSSPKT